MTTSAWIFMLSMWTLITGMTAYCFFKVLFSSRPLGGSEASD